MTALGLGVAILLAQVGFLLYWFLKWVRLRRVIDKLHGPRASFPLGNVHQFKRDPEGNELRSLI